MNYDIQENLKMNELKGKIIREYIYIIFSLLFFFFILPILANYMIDDNAGLDSIGVAFSVVLVLRVLKYIITFIIFIINPIKIIKSYKNEINEIFPKTKRIIYRVATFFPILLSALIILEVPLSNFMFIMKYQTGKGAYKVSSDNYKLPIEFYNELKERGFLYDANTSILMNRLNADHDCVNYIHVDDEIIPQRCYEESTMIGISNSFYYDELEDNSIKDMYKESFPVYMYNAILTLPSQYEKLQYAALGRFSYNTDDYGDYRSKFEDYYIGFKILYVDGKIYAIIGVGEGYDVSRYFDDNSDLKSSFWTYPYNMILSETDNITTYYNNKYYPYGGISNKSSSFEMLPNTIKNDWTEFYPVRKVDKLNIYTVNKIAEELQNGILKESIEYHFSK